jgi:hypothetical protein
MCLGAQTDGTEIYCGTRHRGRAITWTGTQDAHRPTHVLCNTITIHLCFFPRKSD